MSNSSNDGNSNKFFKNKERFTDILQHHHRKCQHISLAAFMFNLIIDGVVWYHPDLRDKLNVIRARVNNDSYSDIHSLTLDIVCTIEPSVPVDLRVSFGDPFLWSLDATNRIYDRLRLNEAIVTLITVTGEVKEFILEEIEEHSEFDNKIDAVVNTHVTTIKLTNLYRRELYHLIDAYKGWKSPKKDFFSPKCFEALQARYYLLSGGGVLFREMKPNTENVMKLDYKWWFNKHLQGQISKRRAHQGPIKSHQDDCSTISSKSRKMSSVSNIIRKLRQYRIRNNSILFDLDMMNESVGTIELNSISTESNLAYSGIAAMSFGSFNFSATSNNSTSTGSGSGSRKKKSNNNDMMIIDELDQLSLNSSVATGGSIKSTGTGSGNVSMKSNNSMSIVEFQEGINKEDENEEDEDSIIKELKEELGTLYEEFGPEEEHEEEKTSYY